MRKKLQRLQQRSDPMALRFYRRHPRPDIETCLHALRHERTSGWESAFCELGKLAMKHIDEVILAFRAEENGDLRHPLLEILASTGRPETIPILAEAVKSRDEAERMWASDGLRRIGTKEARRILWEAGQR